MKNLLILWYVTYPEAMALRKLAK